VAVTAITDGEKPKAIKIEAVNPKQIVLMLMAFIAHF
jgi:hypothetical protein